MGSEKIRKLFKVDTSGQLFKGGFYDSYIEFPEASLNYASLSTFYIYEEFRNTWGGIKRGRNSNSYHYDLELIKHRIRFESKRGSQFKVSTVTNLALVGVDLSIIITDYYEESLSRALKLKNLKNFQSRNLLEIAFSIVNNESYSVFCLDSDIVPPFIFPNTSFPIFNRSQLNLLTNPTKIESNLNSLFSLCEQVNRLLVEM